MDRIQAAIESLEKAGPNAQQCPLRPQYHLLAPAFWINDPNGTIYHDGMYHVFYQHNPYKNKWGSIHWGHARSEDLIHWEHLPVALAPSKEEGEKHCFSGCCVIHEGTPKILYTKIGGIRDVFRGAEQWLALGDDELISWTKHPENPVMDDGIHGEEKVRQWRDPYAWKEGDKWYCVIGGHYKWRLHGAVYLYESSDLVNWKYLHPLYEGKLGQGWIFECPNFFQLNDKHVLVLSPRGKVIYSVGEYSKHKFRPNGWHHLDHGEAFYATNTLTDDKGRTILFGWIKGGGKGWNGCMSLPRVLRLSGEGGLKVQPAKELTDLREGLIHEDHFTLKPGMKKPIHDEGKKGVEVELNFSFPGNARAGFSLLNCKKRPSLGFDGKKGLLFLGKETGKMRKNSMRERNTLRIFLDNSVVEMFLNERECFTGHFYPQHEEEVQLSMFCEREKVHVESIKVWTMSSIWGGP